MPLTKVNLQPGIFKDDTAYSQEGKWIDSDKIRFSKNLPEKIGGWAKLDSDNIASGTVRALLPYRGNNSKRYIGIGTHSHLYLYDDGAGTYTDITPASNYTAGAQHTTISSGTYTYATMWTLDMFGEDLIGVNGIGGRLVRLDTSAFQSNAATNAVTDVTTGVPASANGVIVNSASRQVVLYGAHDGTAANPMNVAFSDLGDISDFVPATSNFAGSQVLTGGNLLLGGIRTRGTILLFSDTAAFTMTFVGQPDVFAFQQVAENAGIVGPQAAAEFNGTVFWMGNDGFYQFAGAVQHIPCSVERHVFDNLTKQQKIKCFAGINPKFNEVWWYYPTGSNDASDDITNYVIYNYKEQVWSIGSLARGAWAPEGIYDNPIASSVAASTSYIYKHEFGTDDESSALSCSLTSGDIDLPQDGDDIMFIDRIVPDFDDQVGAVTMNLKFRNYPNSSQLTESTESLATSTEYISIRARGRQMSMELSSNATSSHWRLGAVRLHMEADGKR